MAEKKSYQVWDCKIGVFGDPKLPFGADGPMRDAIVKAFKEVMGIEPQICFSGWNGTLTPVEEQVARENADVHPNDAVHVVGRNSPGGRS